MAGRNWFGVGLRPLQIANFMIPPAKDSASIQNESPFGPVIEERTDRGNLTTFI